MGKDNLFNKSGPGKTGQLLKKSEHFLTRYAKINSKQITYLNVRPDTIKLLKKAQPVCALILALAVFFLSVSPGKGNKNKNGKMELNQT